MTNVQSGMVRTGHVVLITNKPTQADKADKVFNTHKNVYSVIILTT